MAGVTGVGVNREGGVLGREARTQYAAMARMRWRIFMNGLRSIHGLRDLGATGIAWMFYFVFGLGLGIGLCAAAYSFASRASWQYLPILFWMVSFLWLMFPIAVASFQEQSDLGILLRFPIRFGSYFLLYLISGLMEPSTFVGVLCCLGVWLESSSRDRIYICGQRWVCPCSRSSTFYWCALSLLGLTAGWRSERAGRFWAQYSWFLSWASWRSIQCGIRNAMRARRTTRKRQRPYGRHWTNMRRC